MRVQNPFLGKLVCILPGLAGKNCWKLTLMCSFLHRAGSRLKELCSTYRYCNAIQHGNHCRLSNKAVSMLLMGTITLIVPGHAWSNQPRYWHMLYGMNIQA